MQHVPVGIYLPTQLLHAYQFGQRDLRCCALLVQVLAQLVVTLMEGIERQQVSDCYGLVEVGSSQRKDYVLGDAGAGTYNKQTHINIILITPLA
jgi:hypothetical protein